jgi:hypothetical protein
VESRFLDVAQDREEGLRFRTDHRTLALRPSSDDNDGGVFMKNKYQVVPQAATTEKPAKAEVSDAEFRRRLKNISEWRKKRLAQLRAKDSR